MFEIPSRDGLTTLAEAANAVTPSVAVGLARSLDEARVSILYASQRGIGEFVLPSSETPPALPLSTDRRRDSEATPFDLTLLEALAASRLFPLIHRVVSASVGQIDPPTRFWIGSPDANPLTGDQRLRLQALAAASAELLNTPVSSGEMAARLDRLERAGLLPQLLRVRDVSEIVDRLSTTAPLALPHDRLFLRLFNEDLSKTVIVSGADRVTSVGLDASDTHSAAFSRGWAFHIVDDLTADPGEMEIPSSELGVRSALRIPVQFDDRVIGGLDFLSSEPATYTSVDVAVGRRLAEHVAVALTHFNATQRLAEASRRIDELRARTTNLELLDELLAALIDSSGLPDVFGRISTIARKVLQHDAAALMVRLPDGVHARVYASTGFPGGRGNITEVPKELLQNPDWEHDIFDDLSGVGAPPYDRLASIGFLSLLRVPIRLEGRFAGALIFVSRARAAFGTPDILVARRMADRMALTLARDREIEASKRADEATSRASKLEARVRALTEELDARTGYRRVVGESRQWRQVLTHATQVASTETTVLLLGESGTGKEVVARFLHRASPRSNGPFVALNCAALPEQLLEAELFGYERGAYTGATQSKPGQLEQAAGGTLFLDEVAEMSPSAQAKFLRVLQEREFQRLGGTRVLRTDARFVAATNRDLQRAIANGQFREDLYYRLNVFAIRLPPLRDRRDDILPLSDAFLLEIGRGFGRPPAGISRDARQLLVDYQWPGNVRELRNILERAAILCDGGLITAEHLALNVTPAPTASQPPAIAARTELTATAASPGPARAVSGGDLQTMERSMIEEALQNARFNKSKAAKALGLTRHQLYIRMRKYGLE
jgi:two-component system response regulator FlrC